MVRGGYILLFVVVAQTAIAAETEGTLRTESRSPYVHRLSLYDSSGAVINPKATTPQPYSPAATCGKCHDLGKIRSGWHFNAPDPKVAPGRPGEPWILTDPTTGMQLPISSRPWPGTFRPTEAGLTSWEFTLAFAPFTPGGGLGEQFSEIPQAKWKASGTLEIDCQSCHSADPARDQCEWERQIKALNLKWAPTAAEGLALVRGSVKESGSVGDILAEADPAAEERQSTTVKLIYDPRRFDADDRVLFRINRKPLAERCYFCHSFRQAGRTCVEWQRDEDVHISRGFTCADCHRNGIEHDMARGDSGPFSCEGCHKCGRLGAPRPLHRGLPASHLEKLTCTACHSGLVPGREPYSVRTARAHGLGLASKDRRDDTPPFIVEPVFLRQTDGKIAPHRMLWPAYWGAREGEKITPLPVGVVMEAVGGAVGKESKPHTWRPLDLKQIEKIFDALNAKKIRDVVYVCGGMVFHSNGPGALKGQEHPAAAPYAWPVAHDVRPAALSLGARGCRECHSKKAGFLMGRVVARSPVHIGTPVVKIMYEFQGLDPAVVHALNRTIRYRNVAIGVSLVAGAILALVLINLFIGGLGAALRAVFVRKS